ncbi:unnamed protein product, partial [Polarella glacialis]
MFFSILGFFNLFHALFNPFQYLLGVEVLPRSIPLGDPAKRMSSKTSDEIRVTTPWCVANESRQTATLQAQVAVGRPLRQEVATGR